MTILLIEDDKSLADLITYSLPDDEVLVAGSLAVAHKILMTYRVNLMLIDLNLPDSRGLATLAALKGYAYPKIVTSGCCAEMARQMTGVMDYIDKAAGTDELIARVQFNISKLVRRTDRFAPSVFEEIKSCLRADRMVSV